MSPCLDLFSSNNCSHEICKALFSNQYYITASKKVWLFCPLCWCGSSAHCSVSHVDAISCCCSRRMGKSVRHGYHSYVCLFLTAYCFLTKASTRKIPCSLHFETGCHICTIHASFAGAVVKTILHNRVGIVAGCSTVLDRCFPEVSDSPSALTLSCSSPY